jgi:hypothetical protein
VEAARLPFVLISLFKSSLSVFHRTSGIEEEQLAVFAGFVMNRPRVSGLCRWPAQCPQTARMKRKAKTVTPPALPPAPGAAKFRIASRILWIVGLLQILAGIVMVALASEEADRFAAEILKKEQLTIHWVKSIEPEKRADFDRVHEGFTWNFRYWHSSDILAGVITLAGAIWLRRAPLAATVCPLLLFLSLTAAKAFFQPGLPPALLFVRVLFIWTFIAAFIITLAAQKERRRDREVAG